MDNGSFCILIVDDEPRNVQLLCNILNEAQYKFEFATNGEEALEWLDNQLFDLILLDIMMPGMDGYQVCKKIKEDPRTSHIPVIFLTAKREEEDIQAGFEAGGVDYVTKPFFTSELLARIKTQVEIKTLRGMIPICANCKDVRTDDGLWTQVESYLKDHSPVEFTHSLCPDCVKELYGDDLDLDEE